MTVTVTRMEEVGTQNNEIVSSITRNCRIRFLMNVSDVPGGISESVCHNVLPNEP